jgi:glycosyltransferase involved in cell wall biosynthesis
MTPQISVVMPVRDGARWLGDAIRSVQDQTLGDFELIIVDDGSTDNSAHIMEASARTDPRIRTIHQERLGLVPALNRGLTHSRGRLIARLDADDFAHPERLARQSDYLDRHLEIGLLGTWADQIDERGSIRGALKPATRPEQLELQLVRINPFLHSSIMMRHAVLRKVGCYRPAFEGAEDYDLWLRMSEVTKIANLPVCLLRYRLHPSSVTHRSSVRQLFSARLARRAAQARRINAHDRTSELTTPPDWRSMESLKSPIYGDLARLFRLLDLANTQSGAAAEGYHVDISVLSDRNLVLNHAERRMAQLALLNLMRDDAARRGETRAVLLRHFILLHPLRAIRLAFLAPQKRGRGSDSRDPGFGSKAL